MDYGVQDVSSECATSLPSSALTRHVLCTENADYVKSLQTPVSVGSIDIYTIGMDKTKGNDAAFVFHNAPCSISFSKSFGFGGFAHSES